MAKFEITTRKNHEFQFSLKAENGQGTQKSEGYTTKTACRNILEAVRKKHKKTSVLTDWKSKM
jgi:uncharacterized protein YegP (UPF0339 family)